MGNTVKQQNENKTIAYKSLTFMCKELNAINCDDMNILIFR